MDYPGPTSDPRGHNAGRRRLTPLHPFPPPHCSTLLPFLPPPLPGFPSPGCVICIFTFKFPLPSLSPVSALRVGSRCSLYLPPSILASSASSSSTLCSSLKTRSPSLIPSFPQVSCLSRAPRPLGHHWVVSLTTFSGLPFLSFSKSFLLSPSLSSASPHPPFCLLSTSFPSFSH